LIPGNRRSAAAFLRGAAVAALFICSAALAACSGLAASNEEVPVTSLDPAYPQIVADYLRSTFKDYPSYESFEISEPRWVHALVGWSWIACVRFQDRGHSRTYALFLQSGKVIEGRYAVETDACGAQAYAPFALMTGGLQPLH